MKALGGLVEMLGQDGAQRFLTMALPQIRQYRQELLTCLRQQEWGAAATLAHRLKAHKYLHNFLGLFDNLGMSLKNTLATLMNVYLPVTVVWSWNT